MAEIRYLIKGTYLSGDHKGETFLLRKGGYVTDESRYELADTTYKTYEIAARQCDRLEKQNHEDYKWHQQNVRRRLAKGEKPWAVDELFAAETYEPYAVEIG